MSDQANLYEMNGPEMTENLCALKKSSVGERKTKHNHVDGVMSVKQSWVGECKFKSNIDSKAYGAVPVS